MSNMVLWVHQCTVDYTYQVEHEISSVMEELIRNNCFPEINKDFDEIKKFGLSKDKTINIDEKYDKVPQKLEKICKLLHDNGYPGNIQIGGNPAIGAIRGFFLRQGPRETTLPISYYIGLLPKSVDEVIRDLGKSTSNIIRQAFKSTEKFPAEPRTIGIETPIAKLMLVYGPGRSLFDTASDCDFSKLLDLLNVVLAGAPDSRVVLAINTPTLRTKTINGKEVTELELAQTMIEQIKNSEHGERIRIFVSTRSMDKDPVYARSVLDILKMPNVDIISMSNDEADQLHTAFNKGKNSDEPLAYKVRGLPFNAIKVCHSADGVIMDLGCIPETIITSDDFRKDPAGFLEESLRLSADGATYAMDATAGLGRTSNEAMIRIYSKNVRRPNDHQDCLFKRTFLNVTEPMPAGMISISSAQVVHTRGAIVGVGAIFDGLLLSFLMRD